MAKPRNALDEELDAAAEAISRSRYLVAFTGAGVSVESGVPSFRGADGLWSHYDPKILDIDYFTHNPEECWPVIREIFYDHFGSARPNAAHRFLAWLEAEGVLKALITQNIDDLHHQAGSKNVIEYHGNSRILLCAQCGQRYAAAMIDLRRLPPRCECGAILKPDFVFFGEGIPPTAALEAERAAMEADVMLLIGTTGEVYPAAGLPRSASRRGTTIIEINPERSLYTDEISDIVISTPAGEAADALKRRLNHGAIR